MMNYKGVDIQFYEAKEFKENGHVVSVTDGLVFKTQSKYGRSYGRNSEDALNLAKKLIDENQQ